MSLEFERIADGDAYLQVNGTIAASYGPRRIDTDVDCVEPAPEDTEEFWGVYIHDKDGYAEIVCDVTTEIDALSVLPYVAMRWLGLYAPSSGHTWPCIESILRPYVQGIITKRVDAIPEYVPVHDEPLSSAPL